MEEKIIQTDEQVFFPEGKKILIGSEEFIIMPFVLKNRLKAVRIIVDILKEVLVNGDVKAADIDSLADLSGVILGSAGERLIEIYELVIDRSREWLENNVRLIDEVSIIEAVLEVNDISFLAQRVRALITKTQTQTKA